MTDGDNEHALLVVAALRGLSAGSLAQLAWPHLSERRGRDRVYALLKQGLLLRTRVAGSDHELVHLAPAAWSSTTTLHASYSRHITDRPSDVLLARGYTTAVLRVQLLSDGFTVDRGTQGWRLLLDDLATRQRGAVDADRSHERFLKENTLRHLLRLRDADHSVPLSFDVASRQGQTLAVFIEHPHRSLARQIDELCLPLPCCVPISVIARAADDGTAFDKDTRQYAMVGARHRRLRWALTRQRAETGSIRTPTVLVEYHPELTFRTVRKRPNTERKLHAPQ